MRHPRTLLWSALLAVLALAVLVAACGGTDAASTTTTTVAPATTTTSTTTTATTAAPTTEAPATTAATTTTTQAATTTIDTNTLAEGSGCTPGAGVLPDGQWFGFIDSASATSIEFDLACWFTGDAAVRASAQDGEESPPPNDYYIRNVNPELRTVAVTSTSEVAWLPNVGSPDLETIPYADWLTARETRGLDLQPGVWMKIGEGSILLVLEQYVP